MVNQTQRSTDTRSERDKLVTTRGTRDHETETSVDDEEDENSPRTKQLISEEQTRRSTVRRSERDKLVTTRETRDDETVTRSGRQESTEIQERRTQEIGARQIIQFEPKAFCMSHDHDHTNV